MQSSTCDGRVLSALVLFAGVATVAHASDHLDSPTTVANPQVDVSDVYAWTAADGRHLNLVMTLLGHTFSNKIQYVLHIDSGKVFGNTLASTTIACSFTSAENVSCKLGDVDSASGNPTNRAGLPGRNNLFRVYAGRMDDPFYNNIKGFGAAYETALTAIKSGAAVDAAGCAHFEQATTKAIRNQMTHTEGGAAQNFLGNWTVSAIVISVDLALVSKGGEILAVWGSTSIAGKQIDRMARSFVTNTLIGVAPFSMDDASGLRRQEYNETSHRCLPSKSESRLQWLCWVAALRFRSERRCGPHPLSLHCSRSFTGMHTARNCLQQPTPSVTARVLF